MFFLFPFCSVASTHKDCIQESTLALAENDSQRTRLSRSIQNYTQQTNVLHAVCVCVGGGEGGRRAGGNRSSCLEFAESAEYVVGAALA